MPYTATVGLALTSVANSRLKGYIGDLSKPGGIKLKQLFKTADIHKTKQSNNLYYWNCIEWSCDSPSRISIETFLLTIPASSYHFCYVGDDPNDNKDEGLFNDPWNMLLLREVVID